MKNTGYSEKRFDKDLLNKWLLRGAKSILTAAVLWTVAFIMGIYNDVEDLQAREKVQDHKIQTVEKKEAKTAEKVDDLHWYLIRKNDVKINKTK